MSPSVELVLHQFVPAFGLPISESPPCAKIELYCRLSGAPYALGPGDLRRSPNRLVPFVQWADGSLQAESDAILDRLEQLYPLGAKLELGALEAANEIAKSVETVCYDACLYDRFADPEGWRTQRPITKAVLEVFLPNWTVPLILPLARAKQVWRAKRAGMAPPERGHAASVAAIEAVSQTLEDRPFLAGEHPARADCAAWPNLLHVAVTPNPSPPREAVRADARIGAWIERVAERGGFELPGDWRGRSER